MQEPPSDFRTRIARLGMTQTGFARLMRRLGDNRDEKNILRSIQRMAAGHNRVSGEMHALLGLLESRQAAPGIPQTMELGCAPAAQPSSLDR